MATYILFSSTRHFIQAWNLAKENKVEHRVMAVPESISTECGMSLMLEDETSLLLIEKLLQKNDIAYTLNRIDN